MRFQSVTFDLDGTLLDTVPDLYESARRMLAEIGAPTRSESEIRNFVGQGVVVLVRRCLDHGTPPDEAAMAEAVACFQQHYAAVNGEKTRIFPGVVEGLAAWASTGLPLAVVTNKPAAFTEPLLARLGLNRYFSAVISGDTTPHRKPHPAPLLEACARMGRPVANNLHIGDSKHDIETARNAGCKAVYCVPYGYNEGQTVSASDCDALVNSLYSAWQLASGTASS
ncbi:phosphoglycolate phosphatase [Dechloromonas sp.]|uniref:phosphoglycolate phosphatase n=1 Tax=Dechloromonas sp. TaxID=1917218 RepID=UPI00263F802C|nr:phosphoglycolate phosphatase [Dechloromonas sp.]